MRTAKAVARTLQVEAHTEQTMASRATTVDRFLELQMIHVQRIGGHCKLHRNPLPESSSLQMKIVVTSNCMTGGLTAAFRAIFPGAEVVAIPRVGVDETVLFEHVGSANQWFVSGPIDLINEVRGAIAPRTIDVVEFPEIYFNAFHPDQVYAWMRDGSLVESAAGPYNSAIVLWAWQHHLSIEQTLSLFDPAVMEALGYHERWPASVERLKLDFAPFPHLDYREFIEPLRRFGCFMHTVNHPKGVAIVRLARILAREIDPWIKVDQVPLEDLLVDTLFNASFSCAMYPSIANALGTTSDFRWKLEDHSLIDLREFVSRSFRSYELQQPTDIDCHELKWPIYDQVLSDAIQGGDR